MNLRINTSLNSRATKLVPKAFRRGPDSLVHQGYPSGLWPSVERTTQVTFRPQSHDQTGVNLLMGVRNGARFLPAQLDSIARQSSPRWRLIVSDDGSDDDTVAVVERFGAAYPGRVDLRRGPEKGFSANFMQLIRDLPDAPGHVGFADQDDVWMPDKLARGLAALSDSGGTPTLYAARSWYWHAKSDQRQPSPKVAKPCTFRNALIENVAPGNTIMLNPAAAKLARTAARRTSDVFAHDWWLYLLITGAGGAVHFDNGTPSLLYRQHPENAIGAGQGVVKQVVRKTQVLRGAFSERMKSNIAALDQTRDLLTDQARETLDRFAAARAASLVPRLKGLHRVGPYRQTTLGTLGFWGAAGLGRI